MEYPTGVKIDTLGSIDPSEAPPRGSNKIVVTLGRRVVAKQFTSRFEARHDC
jgi:hypothetical protein